LGRPVKVDVFEVRQSELDRPSDDTGDRLHASAHAWSHDNCWRCSPIGGSAQTRSRDLPTVGGDGGPEPLHIDRQVPMSRVQTRHCPRSI
jgi:hypothetical protein